MTDRITTEPMWWNFATQGFETLTCAYDELTVEQAAQYVTQDDITQSLFRCHVALGKSASEALLATLEACTGWAGQP